MGDKPEVQSKNLQRCNEGPESNPCTLIKLISNWKGELQYGHIIVVHYPAERNAKRPLFSMVLVLVPPSGRNELAFRLKYNYSFFLLHPINYMQFALKWSVTVLILAVTILQQKHSTTLQVCKCFQRWNFKLKSSKTNVSWTTCAISLCGTKVSKKNIFLSLFVVTSPTSAVVLVGYAF